MENLHPKTIWLFFFSFFFRFLFLFLFLSFWFGSFAITIGIITQENPIAAILSMFIEWLVLFILFTIFLWFWAKLTYKNWKYEFAEDSFRKESGVIWKSYVSIPYERIQNVDIYRGIFARILGLSDLQIQTAGSSAIYTRNGLVGMGAEGRLPGLGVDVAIKLRDELIKRSRESKKSL